LRTVGTVFQQPVPSCRCHRFPADGEPSAPVVDARLQGFAQCAKSWPANGF
jgi:hypothetical protein